LRLALILLLLCAKYVVLAMISSAWMDNVPHALMYLVRVALNAMKHGAPRLRKATPFAEPKLYLATVLLWTRVHSLDA